MAKAIAFLVLLIISPAVYAATYNVGGNDGWNTGVDYNSWASAQNFVVGDTLVFTFDGSHAVDEVNQAAYTNCNTNRPISSSTTSPTSITLSAAGTRYFICPRSNHCAGQGQKLAVTTATSSTPGSSPPPSTNGTAPSPPSETPGTPGTTPETPGTSGTPSPPPSPSGSATSILGCRSNIIVGVSLVLAAMFGLMG